MLNIIRDNDGARNKSKRVGRGIGSGKGKTSSRGQKGQTSRSGVAINGFEGGQMPLERRLPKRGFNSLNREIVEVINFDTVEKFIASGKLSKKITIEDLRNTGLLQGKKAKIKLLGTGEIKNKFSIQVHAISNKAKEVAEKSGATIEVVEFAMQNKEAKQEAKKTEKKEAKEVAPKKVATKKTAAKKTVDKKETVAKKTVTKKKTPKKTVTK